MIVVQSATCVGSTCPAQFEGVLEDGREIYARYRHGNLTVRVALEIDGDIFADGTLVFSKKLDPTGWAGHLSYPELIKATEGLITWPAALSPYPL